MTNPHDDLIQSLLLEVKNSYEYKVGHHAAVEEATDAVSNWFRVAQNDSDLEWNRVMKKAIELIKGIEDHEKK